MRNFFAKRDLHSRIGRDVPEPQPEMQRALMTANLAKFNERRLAKDTEHKKQAGRSPAEKIEAQGESHAQRINSTPSV